MMNNMYLWILIGPYAIAMGCHGYQPRESWVTTKKRTP